MSDPTTAADRLLLPGCTPTPLAAYLKALGTLRLVVEQGADPHAQGGWRGETFFLRTHLTREELLDFFLSRYSPTPIVAPWNGGSGFYPKDTQAGIARLETAEADRFRRFQVVIAQCRAFVGEAGLTESPKGPLKAQVLTRLRGELPDDALPWFDAAVVLSDGDPKYPPLLGTGGNDGRLDFTNNFMQRLVELFDPETGQALPGSRSALEAALFDEPTPELASAAVGQFSPGDAGGPNATTGFAGASLVNRWDFVLMLEGAVLFAAAATRRLGSAAGGALGYPFAVRPTSAGTDTGTLVEEGTTRGEIWMPLWSRPMTLSELQHLLSEGRATVGARLARDGLDFARAVASLGIDRGISSFQRYQFVMRSGKAYLATPVGRRPVPEEPIAHLLSDLDRGGYLDRLRRYARQDTAAGSIKRLVRRLEDGIFDLTRQQDPRTVQAVLVALGEIQAAVAGSAGAREALPSLHELRSEWANEGNDRSRAYRIACALAGMHARELTREGRPTPRHADARRGELLPMRAHLVALNPDGAGWKADSTLAVWRGGLLERSLAEVVSRRLLATDDLGLAEKPFFGTYAAPAADVDAYLRGDVEPSRVEALLFGLAFVRIPAALQWDAPVGDSGAAALPAAFWVLKLLFTPDQLLKKRRLLPTDATLPLTGSIVARLSAGRLDDVVGMAWRALRIAGVRLPAYPRCAPALSPGAEPPGLYGRRLLAALAVPMNAKDFFAGVRRLGIGRVDDVQVQSV